MLAFGGHRKDGVRMPKSKEQVIKDIANALGGRPEDHEAARRLHDLEPLQKASLIGELLGEESGGAVHEHYERLREAREAKISGGSRKK